MEDVKGYRYNQRAPQKCKRLSGKIQNIETTSFCTQTCVILLPVNPAPAAPNREAMIAMPVAEPRAAAPPAPSTALAPAATNGAASPPVTPGKHKKGFHQKVKSTNTKKV